MKRRQQERRRKYKRLFGRMRGMGESRILGASRLFELLLGAELVGVSALALAAVGGTGGKTGL
jgi:hypothetical protein